MKPHKKSFSFILLIVISLTTSISHADREQDFKNVISWAESKYSVFFSPASAIIQNQQPWFYTFYPETNTYIGLNNNDEIWVLGDVFGGLLQISRLDSLLNVIANENVGNSCVQVPLISAGSRIVSRYYVVNPNNSSPEHGNIDETYTEYTDTHYTTANEVYVLKADGSSLTFEGTFTRWFTIIDNFIYLNSAESTFVLEGKSNTVTIEYSPELLSGPLSTTICEGQTIIHASTQKISTFNGNTRITEIEASETIINSVNENIQVPAGNFTTVMSTNTTSNTINKQWIDIATGHLVKAETYDTDNFILGDENGIHLKWMQEATLVQ